MGPFLVKRLATFLATLAVASVVVFVVLELLPGNAAEVILGDTATPESLAALQAKLGLDRPPQARYLEWVGGLLSGRTAQSISYDTPTAELIAERLQVTLPLALLAMGLTVALALSLGLYAASRHNRLGDVGVMAASQIGIAIPISGRDPAHPALRGAAAVGQRRRFSGLGRRRHRRPDGAEHGRRPEGAGVAGGVAGPRPGGDPGARHALGGAGGDARRLRAHRPGEGPDAAPGLVAARAAQCHDPGAHGDGLQFANLVTGTIVVENVFVLPGVGRLVFQAISNRDLVVVRDVVMLLAGVVVLVNFVVDLLYALIDPRLRVS